MRRFSNRHGLNTMSELNVTPLLDLAFVLLIIFMITTPLMENSIELALPTSDASRGAVDPNAVQRISIAPDDRIDLNGKVLSLAELEQTLITMKTANPETAVVIRSDKTLAVQKLIDVMDTVQRADIRKVGVVTTPGED
jgi:biopolymer transport protein ExbD